DELQTWIDLPGHPHLTMCCFFRTVENELVIFSEFVDGGSLATWIRDRKLTVLPQILDVAIQTAWALQAAHDAGVIHLDVKPANVLLTQDRVAKITDFGLARTRSITSTVATGPGNTILVSGRGMTPAYCSPEQAEAKPLGRPSDIWSWAVLVLEMFT